MALNLILLTLSLLKSENVQQNFSKRSAVKTPDYFIENEKIKYTGEAYPGSSTVLLVFY